LEFDDSLPLFISHTSGLPFMSRVAHKIDTFTLHEMEGRHGGRPR